MNAFRDEPPTITTMELITNIKDGCAKRGTEIALMSQRLDKLDVNQQKIIDKLDYLDDKLDKKYSAKWVQYVIEFLLIIFALASLYIIFDSAGLPH